MLLKINRAQYKIKINLTLITLTHSALVGDVSVQYSA